jgi:hypothetical protein
MYWLVADPPATGSPERLSFSWSTQLGKEELFVECHLSGGRNGETRCAYRGDSGCKGEPSPQDWDNGDLHRSSEGQSTWCAQAACITPDKRAVRSDPSRDDSKGIAVPSSIRLYRRTGAKGNKNLRVRKNSFSEIMVYISARLRV